jgi:ribosomal protein S17
MAKTIRVRVTDPRATAFHPVLRKPVAVRPRTLLVHDARSSCVAGDVVHVQAGFRASRAVRHVVTRIVAPFGGRGVAQRAPVLSAEERAAALAPKRGGSRGGGRGGDGSGGDSGRHSAGGGNDGSGRSGGSSSSSSSSNDGSGQ